ncbi:MAG: thioredoxin family protein [Caldimonas sp.]
MTTSAASPEPTRATIDALAGPTMLEFGTSWCGFCRAARPQVDAALASYPRVRHLRVEDGSGRPLGRSFRVKLWPTLVFLRDGTEVSRLVRPRDAAAIGEALASLLAPA